MTHGRFGGLLADGWEVKTHVLTDAFDWAAFVAQHGRDVVLLFGIEPNGRLRVVHTRRDTEPKVGWTVIALVPPAPASRDTRDGPAPAVQETGV
jgi:hypothetical protein